MFSLSSYTVKELRERAGRMNILGRSAMNKEELYNELKTRLDICHELALGMETERIKESVSSDEIFWQTWNENFTGSLYKGGKRLPRKLKKSLRKAGLL